MNKALIIQTSRIDVADAPAETRTTNSLGGQVERVNRRAVKSAASEALGRPSSVRRRHKMQALLEELSTRDMDTATVALFLKCSVSSARKYLNDLLEASVVRLRRSVLPADCHVGSCSMPSRQP